MLPLPLNIMLGISTALSRATTRQIGQRMTGGEPHPIDTAPTARLLRFPSLLGPRRAAEILHASALRAGEFQPSTVTGNLLDYRKSQVLWRGEDVAPDVAERVRAIAPELARLLAVPPFPIGEIETQVTVSRGGDYFRRHDDNGSPETAQRRISYVYYVHREPRPFGGGELVVYGARGPGGERGVYVIEPDNDTLVVFPSNLLHEVRPVNASSLSPLDTRVTVNGWVREATSVPCTGEG